MPDDIIIVKLNNGITATWLHSAIQLPLGQWPGGKVAFTGPTSTGNGVSEVGCHSSSFLLE